MIDILKKLKGKKFKIDFHKLDSTVYLIAENLTIKIQSNQFLMVSIKARSEDDALDITGKTGFECVSVMEHWAHIFNAYLRGFAFRLKNGCSLFIETDSSARLEVKEVITNDLEKIKKLEGRAIKSSAIGELAGNFDKQRLKDIYDKIYKETTGKDKIEEEGAKEVKEIKEKSQTELNLGCMDFTVEYRNIDKKLLIRFGDHKINFRIANPLAIKIEGSNLQIEHQDIDIF